MVVLSAFKMICGVEPAVEDAVITLPDVDKKFIVAALSVTLVGPERVKLLSAALPAPPIVSTSSKLSMPSPKVIAPATTPPVLNVSA